jgi:transposase-like protein
MTAPIARDSMYRRRRFEAEIIELCVRWYITYRLSYRDLAAMMAERGLAVSHTTILRWVIWYVPEFEKRWNRWARRVNSSWRVDETYICVRSKWHYLYRAVDKHGKTVDFLLRPDRGIAAAQAFFRKALVTSQRWPRKITLDGHTPSHRALRLLRREDPKWKYVLVRSCKYLNNIVEQDHRAIKRRCASMAGFKSFRNASITLAGIELAHRVRKRQFSFGAGRPRRAWSLKQLWGRALAQRTTRERLEAHAPMSANAPEPFVHDRRAGSPLGRQLLKQLSPRHSIGLNSVPPSLGGSASNASKVMATRL